MNIILGIIVLAYLGIKIIYIARKKLFTTPITSLEFLAFYCLTCILNFISSVIGQATENPSLLSIIIPWFIFIIYLIMSRLRSYKVFIHNVDLKLVNKKLEILLKRYNINYANDKGVLKIPDKTKTKIYFIDKALIIKNYKELSEHKGIIKDFRAELKNMPVQKKKLTLGFDIVMFLLFLEMTLLQIFIKFEQVLSIIRV